MITHRPDDESALRLVALASLLVQLSDNQVDNLARVIETIRLDVPPFGAPALPSQPPA